MITDIERQTKSISEVIARRESFLDLSANPATNGCSNAEKMLVDASIIPISSLAKFLERRYTVTKLYVAPKTIQYPPCRKEYLIFIFLKVVPAVCINLSSHQFNYFSFGHRKKFFLITLCIISLYNIKKQKIKRRNKNAQFFI